MSIRKLRGPLPTVVCRGVLPEGRRRIKGVDNRGAGLLLKQKPVASHFEAVAVFSICEE
jgi:hypothetical protein